MSLSEYFQRSEKIGETPRSSSGCASPGVTACLLFSQRLWRLAMLLAVFGVACSAAIPASPLEQDSGETPEQAPIEVGGQPSDEAIQRRIGDVLSRIEELSDVRVTVVNGVVTLSGTELRPRLREKLTALVSRFDGVVYVDDRLEGAVTVEKRVTPALSKIQRYAREAMRLSPLLLVAFAVVATAGLLARLLGHWQTPWRLLGFAPMARDMAQRLSATVIFLVGVFVALDLLETTALVGAVLGVAGVTGLAIGFAFRDIAENYIAGVLLSVRHRFAIGDHLLIQQHEGKVLRMTSRELMLMTLDGNHLSIPNSTVFKSIVCNLHAKSAPTLRFRRRRRSW